MTETPALPTAYAGHALRVSVLAPASHSGAALEYQPLRASWTIRNSTQTGTEVLSGLFSAQELTRFTAFDYSAQPIMSPYTLDNLYFGGQGLGVGRAVVYALGWSLRWELDEPGPFDTRTGVAVPVLDLCPISISLSRAW